MISHVKTAKNFYSHAREGRDQNAVRREPEQYDFYSHAREGRDITTERFSERERTFLLTRPRGA